MGENDRAMEPLENLARAGITLRGRSDIYVRNSIPCPNSFVIACREDDRIDASYSPSKKKDLDVESFSTQHDAILALRLSDGSHYMLLETDDFIMVSETNFLGKVPFSQYEAMLKEIG